MALFGARCVPRRLGSADLGRHVGERVEAVMSTACGCWYARRVGHKTTHGRRVEKGHMDERQEAHRDRKREDEMVFGEMSKTC